MTAYRFNQHNMNQNLIDEYMNWSKETFPNEWWGDALGKLQNEEINELGEAIMFKDKKEVGKELADNFVLIFKVAHLNGFNVAYIEEEMAVK